MFTLFLIIFQNHSMPGKPECADIIGLIRDQFRCLVFAGKYIHPLSDEFINQINAKQSSWKAGRNFEIKEYDFVKSLVFKTMAVENLEGIESDVHDEDEDVPESFDAREAWPECADIIGLIRDQSGCGAGWAFGGAEVMSDRICIHSNATRKMLVSSQDVLTCTSTLGCTVGTIEGPWYHWNTAGYVTGGLYNNTLQGCKSYFLPNCDHPNNCTNYVDTPACAQQCDDTSLNYDDQYTYGAIPILCTREKQIQLEIYKNGPVVTYFTVYDDFISYKSGIYRYTGGSFQGNHVMKIVGWGVENDVKYWLVANSWNENWGENGYIRILRGSDVCGIENKVISAPPDFTRF